MVLYDKDTSLFACTTWVVISRHNYILSFTIIYDYVFRLVDGNQYLL